jgi:hypothetical protein
LRFLNVEVYAKEKGEQFNPEIAAENYVMQIIGVVSIKKIL